jgi:hypothetical protein
MDMVSLPTYAIGFMLFAWRFLVHGVPSNFTPALVTRSAMPFAMQSIIPLFALQLAYPDPTYILLYVTPLIAALAIVGLVGSRIETSEWQLSHLVLLAFVLGTFTGWVLSTLYFSYNAETAEIFRGRGVAYAQAVLIPAAGLGVSMIERSFGRREALISPGRVAAVVLIFLLIFTNATGVIATNKYTSLLAQDDFNAIRYVGQISSNGTKLAFFAHVNPKDPYLNASSSQRIALFYAENPAAFDATPMAYRDEVSNSTATLQAAMQSDTGFYNYIILSENLGYSVRNSLGSNLKSNGYTAVARFGDTYVYSKASR